MSVSTQPGQIALAVILRGANSRARALVKPITPCLLAQYAVYPGTPNLPSTEEMLMTLPPSGRRGAASRVQK